MPGRPRQAYADTDVEIRRPLSSIGTGTVAAVLTPRIATEFLMFEPQHPVLHVLAWAIQSAVQKQLRLWRTRATGRCKNALQCVVETTGPKFVVSRFRTALRSMGCETANWDYAYPQVSSCSSSHRAEARASLVCADEDLVPISYPTQPGINMSRGWDCGVVRHRNCGTRGLTKEGQPRPANLVTAAGPFGEPCVEADRERHRRGHYTAAKRDGGFFHTL